LTVNGKDQTSSSATAKQKEEGADSDKCHHYHTVQFDCCVDCVFPVCYIQTLVSKVCERFFFFVLVYIYDKVGFILRK
jgi:hypothetical protein